MIAKTVKISNKLGLHARPSAKVVQTATKFKSEITLEKEGIEVNSKSIMGVMMLAAEMGAEITITATGEDEEEAVKAMCEVVTSKFD
ncbi:MAG: HPr family phosphocarrier protein [Candidatus Zixiibacteriota bacterium]